MLENCSLENVLGVGVTPVSKKQSPPNERPIDCTCDAACMKVVGIAAAGVPSQSDQSAGDMLSVRVWLWFPKTRSMCWASDHQNWV